MSHKWTNSPLYDTLYVHVLFFSYSLRLRGSSYCIQKNLIWLTSNGFLTMGGGTAKKHLEFQVHLANLWSLHCQSVIMLLWSWWATEVKFLTKYVLSTALQALQQTTCGCTNIAQHWSNFDCIFFPYALVVFKINNLVVNIFSYYQQYFRIIHFALAAHHSTSKLPI